MSNAHELEEVLEALRKVKKYCENHVNCKGCDLMTHEGKCGIRASYPDVWRLEGKTYYM